MNHFNRGIILEPLVELIVGGGGQKSPISEIILTINGMSPDRSPGIFTQNLVNNVIFAIKVVTS